MLWKTLQNNKWKIENRTILHNSRFEDCILPPIFNQYGRHQMKDEEKCSSWIQHPKTILVARLCLIHIGWGQLTSSRITTMQIMQMNILGMVKICCCCCCFCCSCCCWESAIRMQFLEKQWWKWKIVRCLDSNCKCVRFSNANKRYEINAGWWGEVNKIC